MQIDYLEYLPEKFKEKAIELYLNSFAEKLLPVLGDHARAKEVLAASIAADKCLTAICREELVGIMGIQTIRGGFWNPNLKTMAGVYGIPGGILRLGGLAFLDHAVRDGELYVDGVAVATRMRGAGIGSGLFNLLEQTSVKKEIRTISLDVIDTNPRAKALYARLGFVERNTHSTWPLNLLVKFPFNSSTLMTKSVG